MARAIFLGAEVVFFSAYIMLARAFGVITIDLPSEISEPEAPTQGGGFLEFIDGIAATFVTGFNMIAAFFQLLTFQAPGQTAESAITLIVFTPLTFVTGWILISAIRGN